MNDVATALVGTGHRQHRAVIAATIGNMLESYDFAVYGFFSIIISRLFFPTSNSNVSLLLTVATFGVGFVMRPFGAVVIGSFADRRGRKPALTLTIMMMALGTALIGFAPTYASIGLWAPAIVVTARLLQGFSAGGETGSATAFLIEHAPTGRRGFFGSWQQAGQAFALLVGSLLGAIITRSLSQHALESWGWRAPFLMGLLIGPIGMYIRRYTDDAEEFTRTVNQSEQAPLVRALRDHGRAILTGFAITVPWTVCTYFFLVFMPTYAIRQLKIPQYDAFLANSIGLIVVLILAPVFGALSDRFDRRRMLMYAVAAIIAACYPLLFFLTTAPTATNLMLCQGLFAVLIALYTGPAPAAMAEICPAEIRSTSVSIAYSFAVTIFGGFAPFITTWLVTETGSVLAPAWYIIGTGLLSLLIVIATGPHRSTA